MGSKPKTINAPEMDIGGDIQKYLSGMSSALPQMLSQEQQFRPQFQGLNLGDIQSFLSGVGGQQGLFGLSREATQQAGMGLGEAREAELGQMTGQAGLTRGLMQSLSPEQARVVQGFDDEAQRAFASAQRISPQEQREYQQTAREGAGAAGRIGSNAAIASEVMGRENMFTQKRAEAARAGQNAYSAAQGFYTQPGFNLLGTAPMSYQQGQNFMQQGFGAIGSGTPQLFDPSVGLNLGAAQRANQFSATQANAQNKAAYNAGLMNLGSQAGGAAIAAI